MSVDKPKVEETLWEWRTFDNRVDSNLRRNILRLPVKDGKSIEMQDRYLCRVGCNVNIKIREEDLKVKNFHKTYAGIEQWTTEAYGFSYYCTYVYKPNQGVKNRDTRNGD